MKYFLLPFVVGALSVLQTGLNRSIGAEVGWTMASLINNTVGWIFAMIVVGVLIAYGPAAGIVKPQNWAWWWMLPGLFGLIFVLGLPISVQEIGATKTFVILVGSQIVFAALWDSFVLGMTVSGSRWLGMVLACLGAYLTTL